MDKNIVLESKTYGVIRAVHAEHGLLLCATDVARALGYKKPGNAVRDHCSNVLKLGFPTDGGMQPMSFITPAEAWCFCRSCNLPGADDLTDYLFRVVLPAVKKKLGMKGEANVVFAKAVIECVVAILADNFGIPFDDIIAAMGTVMEAAPQEPDERDIYLDEVLAAIFGGEVA